MKMLKVRDVLNLLDHEVWVEVLPMGVTVKGLDLMVWSADWHCDQYWPEDLEGFLDWEADDIRVKVGTNPETHKRTPVLVIPAYRPVKRSSR